MAYYRIPHFYKHDNLEMVWFVDGKEWPTNVLCREGEEVTLFRIEFGGQLPTGTECIVTIKNKGEVVAQEMFDSTDLIQQLGLNEKGNGPFAPYKRVEIEVKNSILMGADNE